MQTSFTSKDQDFLTQKQEKKIIEYWEQNESNKKPPSISDIVSFVFEDPDLDGRSKQGRLIKQFLAKRSLRAKTISHKKYREDINLTDSQKEYISNNFTKMTCLEMAKTLFKNDKLKNLSAESRIIIDYVKSLKKPDKFELSAFENVDDISTGKYKAPKTETSCVIRVNKYITEKMEPNNLNARQKRNVNSLISYLNTPRLITHINSIESKQDRDLFESQMIRYTYDKPDLTEEEIDQYIILSIEVVNGNKTLRQIEELREEVKRQREENDGRIPLPLVEAIKGTETQYNQCVARQDKMFKALVQDRRKKEEKRISATQSLLNLVDLMKQEESRKQMLELGRKRQKEVEDEIDRISSLDDIKIRIIGATHDQSLYG